MQQDVRDYVRGCAECQRNKINTRPTRAPLSPIFPTHEAMPFETVALDFITKLPVSQGYDSILTVTDHDCTKAAVFIPCKESMMAKETAGLIVQHIFPRFGLPLKFISDRDLKFASKFIRGLCKGTGTTQNISRNSTSYHHHLFGQMSDPARTLGTIFSEISHFLKLHLDLGRTSSAVLPGVVQ